jgi:hypothetical protein
LNAAIPKTYLEAEELGINMGDEKPDIEHQSADERPSGSVKGKGDVEAPSYLPRDDTEYNVTFKTWCVVMVSTDDCTPFSWICADMARFWPFPMALPSGLSPPSPLVRQSWLLSSAIPPLQVSTSLFIL